MDYYNISGYGVDLTVLANAAHLTDAEQNLYAKLIHSDILLDTIDVLASRHAVIVTDTPSNSDAFDYFVNIPDISRVLPADETDLHLFTAAEADHALRVYISDLFQKLARENNVEHNDKVLHALIVDLKEKVAQEAAHQSFQDFC